MILYLLHKIACLAVCMAYLTPMRYSRGKSAVYVAIFQGAIYIANCAVYLIGGEKVYASISLFTIGVPGFLCFHFLSRHKGFRVLFSLLTVTVFGMLSSFLGYIAEIYTSNPVLQYGVKFLSFLLITLYTAKVIRKPYLSLTETLQKGWGFLSLIPFLLINIISLLQYYPSNIGSRPENVLVLALVFAMTFIFYTIVFMNFKNILEFLQIKQDKELLTVQAQMYKNEYKALIDHVDGMRMLRHDMRHHISAINAFLQDGNLAEARDYLKKLDGSLTNGAVKKYCENYAVNAILSSLISRANAEGITVDCEAVIPSGIAIDSMELGLVFANALDNAINACKSLTDPAEKNIRVDCREHCGQLYIRISNPFRGEVRFDGEFPVPEDHEHGIGTRSIASIAQRYGGLFSFTAKDGMFNATVTLNQKTTTGA